MTVEEQKAADIEVLRDYMWENREQVTDDLVLHDCDRRTIAQAMLRVLGWNPDFFVIADLVSRRDLLDG